MKAFLSLCLLLLSGSLLAQTPGAQRNEHLHGIGFGLEAPGIALSYDLTLGAPLQLHFFGALNTDQSSSLLSGTSIQTTRRLTGISVRFFPSEEYGVFIGLGGGAFSAKQTVDQSITCSSVFTALNPDICTGNEGTTLSQTTESELSGTAGFGEIGWQGNYGIYVTLGARVGTLSVADETDRTDQVLDASDDRATADDQWTSAQHLSGAVVTVGVAF